MTEERPEAAGRELARAGLSLVLVVAAVLLATMVLIVALYDPGALSPDLACALRYAL